MAKFSQTATKVTQMMEIAFDLSSPLDKRENATTNLLVLAKENAGITTFITFIRLNLTFSMFPILRW